MTQPTQPNVAFDKYSQQLKAHITKAFDMGVAAAKRADADDFGIDARISVAHEFVDLEVKGHSELLETLIGGPWINPAPYEDHDTIKIAPVNYEREVVIDDDFVRVGLPTTVVLPKSKLTPVPKVVGPGVAEFRLYLTDLNYLGANYRGFICLKPTAGAVAKGAQANPPKVVITAGL